jgi:hypothetical protein
MWEVDLIGGSNQVGIEDINLRVKNISLPSRSIEPIDTWFYGFKQSIPGRTTFSNQINLSLEENEDQDILKSIYDWLEKIQGVDPLDLFATLSSVKRYTKNMIIKLLKFNGQSTKYFIELKNVYPLSINELNLDFNSNDAIRFDVSFNYDYWRLIKN